MLLSDLPLTNPGPCVSMLALVPGEPVLEPPEGGVPRHQSRVPHLPSTQVGLREAQKADRVSVGRSLILGSTRTPRTVPSHPSVPVQANQASQTTTPLTRSLHLVPPPTSCSGVQAGVFPLGSPAQANATMCRGQLSAQTRFLRLTRHSAYRPERAGTLCFRQFGPGHTPYRAWVRQHRVPGEPKMSHQGGEEPSANLVRHIFPQLGFAQKKGSPAGFSSLSQGARVHPERRPGNHSPDPSQQATRPRLR